MTYTSYWLLLNIKLRLHLIKSIYYEMNIIYSNLNIWQIWKKSKDYVLVWIARFSFSVLGFSFFFQHMDSKIIWIYYAWDKNHCSHTITALFTHYSSTVYAFKNIKNGSHRTIHTFKKYFSSVFSIFSFQRQQVQSKRTYVSIHAWAIQEFVFINAI